MAYGQNVPSCDPLKNQKVLEFKKFQNEIKKHESSKILDIVRS